MVWKHTNVFVHFCQSLQTTDGFMHNFKWLYLNHSCEYDIFTFASRFYAFFCTLWYMLLAPYPWSCSVKTGVWLRALGNGDQRRPMGREAREGLYVFCGIKMHKVHRWVFALLPFYGRYVLQYFTIRFSQINVYFCRYVQLFLNSGLATDYVIMWSTQNLNDKQVILTRYFLFSFIHVI